jgi:hypothetical protein
MNKINNKKDFSIYIEQLAVEKNISFLDAVLHHCEKANMEPETAAKLLTPKVKESIEQEAASLNLLKEKFGVLPV